MQFDKIVLLAGKWDTTPIVYNFLKESFGIVKVLLEDPVPRKKFLQKRIKKLGWFTVGGQVMFQLIAGRLLNKTSKKRIQQIIEEYRLQKNLIPLEMITEVPSANSDECLKKLKELQPGIVVVHGTRIISKKILQEINAIFINIHAGITPLYRGSHGAYWALANNDKGNCGVTVHLVDAGIDTGNILAQTTIPFTSKDNFSTYPYLQLAEGLYLLKDCLEKLKRRERLFVKNDLGSGLWHHPTLWGYLWKRLSKGVK